MFITGESNVKYLFTQKVMDWTHTQYSHWGTFASLLSVCGESAFPWIFSYQFSVCIHVT